MTSVEAGNGAVGRRGRPLTRVLAIVCVLVLAAAGVMWWMFSGADQRRVTAYFNAAVGIYPGGDVRVLGVPVGKIDEVQPQGKTVRVTMSLNNDVKVPADAGAVVVSPSVVSDRYIQLAPVYKGGPVLADGAVIPQNRTATPVELDEIYQNLNKLSASLGPQGANSNGALTNLLNTTAANLGGNGQALSDMLQHLGEAGSTLSGSSKDLFATVDNLQRFTSMLAANDGQVRNFNTQMQQVNSFLADERGDLGAALSQLAIALDKVQTFVRDNRQGIKSNVDQLNSVATVLVKEKAALNETLTDAPVALSNLQNAYNAASGTLDTRADFNELAQPPLVSLCKMLGSTPPQQIPPQLSATCAALAPVVSGKLPLPTPAQVANALSAGQPPPLPLPIAEVNSALSGSPAAGGGNR